MSSRTERAAVAAILLAAAALRVLFIRISAPADDAYITFRYARNLAEGIGFVYNAGERVLGTTTPLFTLLLSPFCLLRIPLEMAAGGIAVLADLGVAFLLYRLLREPFGRETALFAAAIYGLFYAAAAACGFGMETQLFSLLVMIAITEAMEGRRFGATTATALSALTRPEGFLLAAILGCGWLYGNRRRRNLLSWGPAALFVALILPWVVFATWYFGSPIPNSVLAKLRQRDVAFEEWARFFLTRNPLILLLWLGSVVGAGIGFARRSRTAGILAAWAVTYPIFFLLGRPPFLGLWYFPPLAPALAGLFAIGAVSTMQRVVRGSTPRALVVGGVWLLVVAVGLPRNLESARWSRTLSERVYRPIAEWVVASTRADDLVHIPDIGYVGYFTGRRILDSSALVSPEVAEFYSEHRSDPVRDVRYVLKRAPRVVILPVSGTIVERFAAGGLLDRYRPALRFQTSGTTKVTAMPDSAAPPSRSGRFAADFIAFERID